MAGDWIPMRLDLYEDPAVTYMAERIGQREEVVVGYLHRIWAWASRQSQDGCVKHVTLTSLGRVTSLPDFPQLMADAGWLEHGVDTDGKPYISFPNWDRWLGESAKKRISASRRKQKERVTQMSQKVVTANKQKDHVPAAVRREVYERDGFTCVYCQWNPSKKAVVGPYIGAKLSVHHVQPESRGGATNAENLVTCCTVCNQKLSNKTPDELCHKNVTKVCDKSVTTVQERREERDTTKSGISMVRPTIEDVVAYCKERGNTLDPHAWMDHYTANGWKVGKNPMKDWKAAVRQWERNDLRGNSGKASAKPVTFGQQRQQNMAEMLQRIKAQEEAGVAGFLGGSNGQSK